MARRNSAPSSVTGTSQKRGRATAAAAKRSTRPLVGVVMGSRSDWETMKPACDMLRELGVAHEALDVGEAVSGLVARAEGRAADVDGISTVVDSLDADVGIAGGGEQFEFGTRHGGPDC